MSIFKYFKCVPFWNRNLIEKIKAMQSLLKPKVRWYSTVSFHGKVEWRDSYTKMLLQHLKHDLQPWEFRNSALSRLRGFHALTLVCGLGQDLHYIITSPLPRTQQLRVWACSLCQEKSQLEMRHKFNSCCVSVENRWALK